MRVRLVRMPGGTGTCKTCCPNSKAAPSSAGGRKTHASLTVCVRVCVCVCVCDAFRLVCERICLTVSGAVPAEKEWTSERKKLRVLEWRRAGRPYRVDFTDLPGRDAQPFRIKESHWLRVLHRLDLEPSTRSSKAVQGLSSCQGLVSRG